MNILIEVKGGVIQGVTTSEDANIVIVDWDNIEAAMEALPDDSEDYAIELVVFEPDGITDSMWTMFGGPDVENKISRELKRIGF